MVDALQKITASSFRERCKLFSKKVSLQNTMNEICCLIEETVNNEEFCLRTLVYYRQRDKQPGSAKAGIGTSAKKLK